MLPQRLGGTNFLLCVWCLSGSLKNFKLNLPLLKDFKQKAPSGAFVFMDSRKFNSKNKIFTPTSGTTAYIDYSAQQKTLEVEFLGGKTYRYFNVKPETWEAYKKIITSGGSSGRFVNFEIKPNYRFEEIK